MKLFGFFTAQRLKPVVESEPGGWNVRLTPSHKKITPWEVVVSTSDHKISVAVRRGNDMWDSWVKEVWVGKSWTGRRYRKIIAQAKRKAAEFTARDEQVALLRERTRQMTEQK